MTASRQISSERNVVAPLAGDFVVQVWVGAKTEENILRGIRQMRDSGERVQAGVALDLAEELLGELQALKQVRRATYAGSLRRMCETIGDIALLVASTAPGPVMGPSPPRPA